VLNEAAGLKFDRLHVFAIEIAVLFPSLMYEAPNIENTIDGKTLELQFLMAVRVEKLRVDYILLSVPNHPVDDQRRPLARTPTI